MPFKRSKIANMYSKNNPRESFALAMAVKQALILNIKFTELESVTMID